MTDEATGAANPPHSSFLIPHSSFLIPHSSAAAAAWSALVRANQEQAERMREPEPAADFYAPVARQFRADPRRTDEPALDYLRSLVAPGETWLDIGAGGGRYALPLALLAGEVIALDPSDGMLAVLRQAMAEERIENVRIVQSRWPAPELGLKADVALIAHVGYDIAEIGPFLDAVEASAKRLCVAVLMAEAPASPAAAFWPAIHGEERHLLPALPDFLALMLARGRLFELRLFERQSPGYPDREMLQGWLRQQLFIAAGGAKDEALAREIDRRVREVDGRLTFGWPPVPLGVVTWRPPR